MIDLSDAEIAIVSVVIGWVLGQGSELIKAYVGRRSLLKAFKSELVDLRNHLTESKKFCIKGMDFLLQKKPAYVWPQNAVTPIYENYYKDICMLFSESERRLISHIYGHISSFNDNSDYSNDPKKQMNRYFELCNDIAWATGTIDCFLNGKFKNLQENTQEYQRINAELREISNKYLA